jgi:hypothetical protein
MDMYERHRREFERSVARLDKADLYDFFQGDVPDELDECCANGDPKSWATSTTTDKMG